MKRVLLVAGCSGILAATATMPAQAQVGLGSVGASTAISSTLSGIGVGAAGSLAMQRARQVGGPGGAFMDDGSFPGGGQPGVAGQAGAPGAGGLPDMPPQGGAAFVPAPRRQPAPYNRNISGGNILSELLRSSPDAGRPAPVSPQQRTPGQSARTASQLTATTPQQRTEAIHERYQKPPVGWLSYYLKDDRYKLTSNVWNYVTIEDDQGRYPVRYYYQPWSPRMLALLSNSPQGVRRADRVIGFRTWQDAMLAGYQPDPVSQPAPASQIANLARMTQGEKLARYTEFVYAGQVSPQVFDANYRYFQSVINTINSNPRTRSVLGRAVEMAVGAAIGENPPPRTIEFSPRSASR